MEVLLSFIGNRDPFADQETNEFGPVLSLLQARQFARVFLFCTGPEYVERAKTVERIASDEFGAGKFAFINLDLDSVVDYEEIYSRLDSVLSETLERAGYVGDGVSVLLDPGTPQMQTCWFLLVRSGRLPAKLLQGVPPRFAGGAYKVKEVQLESDVLPHMESASLAMSSPAPLCDAVSEPQTDEWISPGISEGIIGEASSFKDTLTIAHRCAAYDVTVLITGETGTGKGVVAKFIHDASPRRHMPMLPVNCASITATMAESELFGHKKGSFTGAQSERLGKFRAADGGTLFLDEIGDLPLEVQPKLLRVLEDGKFSPLGGDALETVNVRVIAATNRKLEELIEQGLFRRDLYERLAQTPISVPPLRDRREDIALLITEFRSRWNARYHEEKGFSEETMTYLLEYPWPGNVREVENAVSTLCATGQSSSIGPQLLPAPILTHFDSSRSIGGVDISIPDDGLDLKAYMFNIEKQFYLEALDRSGGNRTEAANLVGVNPPAFRKALKERFGIGVEVDDGDN